MKILLDHQAATYQNYGGVSRLFYELMQNIDREKYQIDMPVLYSDNHYIRKTDSKIRPKPDPLKWIFKGPFPGKGKAFKALQLLGIKPDADKANKKNSMKVLKQGKYNLFHPTYYDTYFMDTVADLKTPFVLTVFDMIHEKFSRWFPGSEKLQKNKKMLAEKSEKVIAISESTKRDLHEIYGISNDKIEIIHLSASFSGLKKTGSLVQDKYVLFVGDRWIYKNFTRFVYSVSSVLRKYGLKLVCAGSRKFQDYEIEFLHDAGVHDLAVHIPIDNDQDLFNLYSDAVCFVFPSLYEGFGIPLLESFSAGCPVICSRGSSFDEVTGGAAEQFDPYDALSIGNSLKKVLESETYRQELQEKGYAQNAKFSWKRMADEHSEIYRKTVR